MESILLLFVVVGAGKAVSVRAVGSSLQVLFATELGKTYSAPLLAPTFISNIPLLAVSAQGEGANQLELDPARRVLIPMRYPPTAGPQRLNRWKVPKERLITPSVRYSSPPERYLNDNQL